jgi:hypothetical protein
LCLEIFSPEEITLVEGWMTLAMFILLILFAYAADRINNNLENSKKNEEEVMI